MRTIFITGVSKGLGQSLSQSLESKDTRIIGFGRSKGRFSGSFHACDFTQPQDAAQALDSALAGEALEDNSQIIFINNAGTLGTLGKIQNIDAANIQQTITCNLAGSSIAAAAFLRRVEKVDTQKLIIQISSGAALPDKAKASWSLYCACKAGQEQLVRAIAIEQETAQYPTTLINVNPGVMETDMQTKIRALSPEDFPEVDTFVKMHEEGSIPSPDTIAEKIRVLIEDHASLENGKTYTFANYKTT